MAVTIVVYGRYHLLTGTAAEVLQALQNEGVSKDQIVKIADDATLAVFQRGR